MQLFVKRFNFYTIKGLGGPGRPLPSVFSDGVASATSAASPQHRFELYQISATEISFSDSGRRWKPQEPGLLFCLRWPTRDRSGKSLSTESRPSFYGSGSVPGAKTHRQEGDGSESLLLENF
ncbi:hypothetical protein MRB53_031581 [Persea americana]|uniref:Uncharacterized protein n=1 Tax=Persea americana TaxID=3435 RepID=A0ACC2KPH9_PERAE|nr:hypothetical protein MRB53_031581 [Persea americana]